MYWREERQWFTGTVKEFNPRNGKHKVIYDDGDEEHLILAAETFKWVKDPSEEKAAAAPRPRGDAEAGASPPERRSNEIASTDPNFPSVGEMIWGRVKARPRAARPSP